MRPRHLPAGRGRSDPHAENAQPARHPRLPDGQAIDRRRASPDHPPAFSGHGVGFGLVATNTHTLAHSEFSAPAVLATMHTFTLGFLTSTVMGMLYQ